MTVNYELVYKARDILHPLTEARRKLYAAQDALRKEEYLYKERLRCIIGKSDDEVEFTNIACMASGIMYHIYDNNHSPKGLGKRKCVFCGCDDFDGF